MPSPIIIFSKDDEESARAFSQFASGRNIEYAHAFQKGRLSEQIKNDNGPIFFMGHTDDTRKNIGGMSPKALANQFANGINKEHRAQIQDLYLISCESGLLPDPSLAKQLGTELNKLGFINLHVHAVSSAPVQDARGMYVEVITRQGVFSTAPVGSLQAYAYTNDSAGVRRKEIDDKLAKLEQTPKEERTRAHHSELAVARKQMTEMIKAGTPGLQPLMNTQQNISQLMNEFNKPQNTILPQQAKPGLFDRFLNAVGFNAPPVPTSNVVATYKINISKMKFIAAYDEMIEKLSFLQTKYSEKSPAYIATKELIEALEPIYTQAQDKSNTIAPVALGRMELDRVEKAVETAQKELPQHRGFFSKILEYLGIKTDSEKKLSAISEVISEGIEEAKNTGPSI